MGGGRREVSGGNGRRRERGNCGWYVIIYFKKLI